MSSNNKKLAYLAFTLYFISGVVCMMIGSAMSSLVEMYGQPLEKIIGNIIRVSVTRPKQRPYKTNNFYAVLQRQDQLDKEVHRIVTGKQKARARQR